MNSNRPDKASELSIDELIKRYLAGASLSQLEKAAGVSMSTVRKRLLDAGVTCRPRGRGSARIHSGPIPGLQQILSRYANGEPCPALAKEFGLSPSRIYKALREAGVPTRPRGLPPGTELRGKLTVAQRAELVADLRAAKHPTLTAIAKKYGVVRDMVRQYAEKAGVTYYRRAERYARTSWVAAQRKLERQTAERKRKKIKAAALAAKLDAVKALWLARASDEEILLKTGVRGAKTRIADLRKRYPGRFPFRNPNRSKDAVARNAPAHAAKAAAVAQKKEAFRQKIQLLEALWDARASLKEISRQTGYVSPSHTVKALRERYPGRFLPREHSKIEGTKPTKP